MANANESSAIQITFSPLDYDGQPFTPDSCRYKLTDQLSTNEIIAWTTIPAADLAREMEVTIPASANAMVDDGLAEEVKVFTVETNFGTDSAHIEEYEYTVTNKQFVT